MQMSEIKKKPSYLTILVSTTISVAIAAIIGTLTQQAMFGRSNIVVTVAIVIMVGFGVSRTMWGERQKKQDDQINYETE